MFVLSLKLTLLTNQQIHVKTTVILIGYSISGKDIWFCSLKLTLLTDQNIHVNTTIILIGYSLAHCQPYPDFTVNIILSPKWLISKWAVQHDWYGFRSSRCIPTSAAVLQDEDAVIRICMLDKTLEEALPIFGCP